MSEPLPEIPTVSTTAQKKVVKPNLENKAEAEDREQIKWERLPWRRLIVGGKEESDAVVPEIVRRVTEGRG